MPSPRWHPRGPRSPCPAPVYATLSLIPLGPRSSVSQLCSAPSRERRDIQLRPSPRPPPRTSGARRPARPPTPRRLGPRVRAHPAPSPQGAALTFPHHRLQPRGRHLPLRAPPLPGLFQGGGVALSVIHVDSAPRGLAPAPCAPGPAPPSVFREEDGFRVEPTRE